MMTLKNKILVMAVLSVVLMACSKEEVKPFNGGNVTSNTNLSEKTTGSDDSGIDPSTTSNTSGNGTSTVDDNSGNTDGGDASGSGITDGGTSSDYDSKGTKRKPGKN